MFGCLRDSVENFVRRMPVSLRARLRYSGHIRLYVTERDIPFFLKMGISVDPWAFIRVHNEITTIDKCLESILPVIHKGVIGYHECTDGTEEYIREFCRLHPGFIPFNYPHSIVKMNDRRYEEGVPAENRLDTYYNAVLDLIPNGEWFIKIDCDHVYDTQKLGNSFFLPRYDNDTVFYNTLNLHYQDGNLYIRKKLGLKESGEMWLMKKKNQRFEMSVGEDRDKNFYAWERIRLKGFNHIYTELSNWHFPCLKNHRCPKDMSEWQIFSEWSMSKDDEIYFRDRINEDMLDEERIKSICRTFNWEGERILPKVAD